MLPIGFMPRAFYELFPPLSSSTGHIHLLSGLWFGLSLCTWRGIPTVVIGISTSIRDVHRCVTRALAPFTPILTLGTPSICHGAVDDSRVGAAVGVDVKLELMRFQTAIYFPQSAQGK